MTVRGQGGDLRVTMSPWSEVRGLLEAGTDISRPQEAEGNAWRLLGLEGDICGLLEAKGDI